MNPKTDVEILQQNEQGRRLLHLGEDVLCVEWVLGRMEEARAAGREEGAAEQVERDARIAKSWGCECSSPKGGVEFTCSEGVAQAILEQGDK